MSTNNSSPNGEALTPPDELSDDDREMLKWIRENSDQLGSLADSILQSEDAEASS